MKTLRIIGALLCVGAFVLSGCTDSPDLQGTGGSTSYDVETMPAVLITLTPISTAFTNPVGIDHHQPTNKVVMSVNYPTGVPHNLELVASDGSHAQFSSASGLTEELKIATAKDALGGFTPGEIFTGNGVDGQIVRVSADGSVVTNPWVDLPGAGNGLMRGSLHVDRTGVWGGDLVVVTTAGEVWRVNSAGTPAFIADVDTHLEGLTTVPNDASKYGPWAGKAIAGAEALGRVYAFGTDGSVNFYTIGVSPEDIDLIPANQNFFGVDFGGATLWGAPPSEFASMVGDILMAQEFPGNLYDVKWDGSAFVVTVIATVTQWEHVTFSTAGIVEVPPIGASLDIHPTSCPNPFNMNGLANGNGPNAGGVLPVAIVGSESFDVNDVDVSTVKLEGVSPLRSSVADVTQPATGDEDCPCTTEGPDGIADLTLKFSRQAIAATLGTVNSGDVVTLTLTGKLDDGTAFSISDCIVIRNGDAHQEYAE